MVDAEHRGDLVAVVPDALAAREDLQGAVGLRHGEGRLGLEEGMLDALGLEDLVDRVGRGGERRVDVAALVGRAGQDVALELPDGVLGIVDRRHGVGQRAQRAVGDLDELGRIAGGLLGVGDDDGKDVAEVGGAAALGYEHRPVGVDDPDPQLTGHVRSGEDRLDSGDGEGGGGIDPQNVGPGVIAPAAAHRAACRER